MMFGSNPNEYDLKNELATCCYGLGTVYLAKHVPSHEYVAVKKFKMDKAKEESNMIMEEVLTMRQFDFPHVLPIYAAFVNNLDVYAVSPLMCYTSCRDAMNSYFSSGFPEIFVCLILRDVLQGLEYLHRKGFMHRAIRASHILINHHKAVLSGYRHCTNLMQHGRRTRLLYELPPKSIKNLNWLAPEVLAQNLAGYTQKSDIYSIGITTCELANGLEPFSNMPTTFMFTEKMRGNQPALLDCSTCPDDVGEANGSGTSDAEESLAAIQTHQIYSQRTLSDSFHKFAETCMERFPEDRPDCSQLLSHVFFKQCKHTSLAEQFSTTRMYEFDCTKMSSDEVGLTSNMIDLSLGGNFDWDF